MKIATVADNCDVLCYKLSVDLTFTLVPIVSSHFYCIINGKYGPLLSYHITERCFGNSQISTSKFQQTIYIDNERFESIYQVRIQSVKEL